MMEREVYIGGSEKQFIVGNTCASCCGPFLNVGLEGGMFSARKRKRK